MTVWTQLLSPMVTEAPNALRCAATPLEIRGLLARLEKALPAGICDPRIELALAEALNNVAEHAYGDGQGMIALEVSSCPEALRIALRDQGRPMPDYTVPADDMPHPDALPEGGWGWGLIHACCDGIDYQRLAGENRLTLTFRRMES